MTEALPTLREELDRKTIDVLTDLTHAESTLRISPEEQSRIALVIWTLTAGLVSEDVLALAQQAAEAAGKRIHHMSRQFLGHGEFVRIVWTAHQDGYVWLSYNPTTLERKIVLLRKTPIHLREPELRKIFQSLLAKSYLEIK